MADVQVEKGYVRTAHRLDEAITYADFTGSQHKIIRCLIRVSYGWGRRTIRISRTGIAKLCHVSDKGGFQRAFDELLEHGVLIEVAPAIGKRPSELMVNKNFEAWGRFSVASATLAAIAFVPPKRVPRPTLQGPATTEPAELEFEESPTLEGVSIEEDSATLEGVSNSENQNELNPPSRVDVTHPQGLVRHVVSPLNPRLTTCLKKGKKESSSTGSTDHITRAGIARDGATPTPDARAPRTPTHDDPRDRFIAAHRPETQADWRVELAQLEQTYGAAHVIRACRDALMATKPVTTPYVFRIFCASADAESRAAASVAPKPAIPSAERVAQDRAAIGEQYELMVRYTAARDEAVDAWAADPANADAWVQLRAEASEWCGVGATMPGGATAVRKRALALAGAQLGFPPYEQWLVGQKINDSS